MENTKTSLMIEQGMFDEFSNKNFQCQFCPHPLSDHYLNELNPNERKCRKCDCFFDYENKMIRISNTLGENLKEIKREKSTNNDSEIS